MRAFSALTSAAESAATLAALLASRSSLRLAISAFRALPFADGTFHIVAFDPPHLEKAGPRSWLAAKYGKLGPDWREDIRQGFAECFRVLAPNGTLVFKWNETQVKVSEVLALTQHQPLFGHPSGRKGLTHWLVPGRAAALPGVSPQVLGIAPEVRQIRPRVGQSRRGKPAPGSGGQLNGPHHHCTGAGSAVCARRH